MLGHGEGRGWALIKRGVQGRVRRWNADLQAARYLQTPKIDETGNWLMKVPTDRLPLETGRKHVRGAEFVV